MAPIPAPLNLTVAAIAAAVEAARSEQWESIGISAGLVGTECERAIWYEFRRASPLEINNWRKHRIFERGNIEEDRLLDLLRLIDCEVTHEQEKVRDCGGHVRGKIDAQAIGIPEAPVKEHVVECKSSNEKSYKAVVKDGVQKAKPLHYATMQFYMHKRGLDRCLYMMTNKNNEDIHTERVRYDVEFTLRMIARLERIIQSDDPPLKLHENPKAKMAFACGFCKHLAICHEGAWPRVNCRTCIHSTPELNGDAHWSCARWNKPLSLAEQEAACPTHLFLPGLIDGKQTDVNEEAETITYKMRDGSTWIDGGKIQ